MNLYKQVFGFYSIISAFFITKKNIEEKLLLYNTFLKEKNKGEKINTQQIYKFFRFQLKKII